MKSYKTKSYIDCSFARVQKIISGKWNMLIIYLLNNETLRFGELHRRLPVTQATLSKQLKILEEHGIIYRNVFDEIPPKVEYSLTELGEKFSPILEALENWSKEYDNYHSDIK